MQIGYARISTKEQSLGLQEDAFRKADCQQIYSEKINSGKADRPHLNEMLGKLREGDVIVVVKQIVGFRSLQDHIPPVRSVGGI